MARLKKGSAAAKAWGAKMRRLRRGKTKSKSTSSSHKRRNPIKRGKVRMPKYRKVKVRRKRGSASILGFNTSKMLAAGLYGAARARISGFIAPYTARIPAGAVTDEVGMVLALYAAKKFLFKKAGVLREAASVGQSIEFARMGEAVATGQLNLGALSPTQNAGNLF